MHYISSLHLTSALILLSCLFIACTEQVAFTENKNVRIVRDTWGVPHITGKTDADVVYGLAWAQCEDDFITMQEQLIAGKGMYGELKGKDGLILDFAIKFMGLREEVDKRYPQDLSPEHLVLLKAYVNAVNIFAQKYPEEVLLPDAFPLTVQDILVGYLMGVANIAGADVEFQTLMENKLPENPPSGSNAFAISGDRTDTGHTFLAINSHQPLEGWYSWYEAHLHSEEGLNIIGGTFPGGLMIFHGVNEHLGWAMTVNDPDVTDIYRLEMSSEHDDHYIVDGKEIPLIEKEYWSWMKVAGPLKIPIKQSCFESIYGPTFKTEQGVFAWRTSAVKDIRVSEQWFAMNKASNFTEFKKAIDMRYIPSTNIVYADKSNSIYYISNAKIPKRSTAYNWSTVLPGNTHATNWNEEYIETDSLPQVLNPPSGFVFNTNNSPFNSTAPKDDPAPSTSNHIYGFQGEHLSNNRSKRFLDLIGQYDTITYEDFKTIKYDLQYPDTLVTPHITNLELLFSIEVDHTDAAYVANKHLQEWDRKTTKESKIAALFFFTYAALEKKLKEAGRWQRGGTITEQDCLDAIYEGARKITEKFGRLKVPLGDIQKHIRGDVTLPLAGGPDILAAMYWKENESTSEYKGIAGESYIALVQFTEDGPIIETINAYGSSAEPDSPHYTDQMEMFANQELKSMTLDMAKVIAEADTIYHPLISLEN
jgi:acyl-homoserine-lactone acylase